MYHNCNSWVNVCGVHGTQLWCPVRHCTTVMSWISMSLNLINDKVHMTKCLPLWSFKSNKGLSTTPIPKLAMQTSLPSFWSAFSGPYLSAANSGASDIPYLGKLCRHFAKFNCPLVFCISFKWCITQMLVPILLWRMHQHWWYSCYCPNHHTNFFLGYHHSGFLSHHTQSPSVEVRQGMQDAVKSHNLHQICHKRWNKRTITTEHHGSFIDLESCWHCSAENSRKNCSSRGMEV